MVSRTQWRAGAAALTVTLAVCGTAHADRLTIKQPGLHPDYGFEAEPHALLGLINPPGPANDEGFGLGFRGTIEVFDNGFIQSINNTIGIGFGIDYIHYDDDDRYWCGGPGNRRFCDWGDDFDFNYFFFPVVMQWNFWLSQNWSVFGEVGAALYYVDADWWDDGELEVSPFIFSAGGRFHFADFAALTMRIGYPAFSVGVSFFL